MRIEYQRTAKHSYMVVKEADGAYEDYEVQMILHNDLSSLLPMQIIVGNGQEEFWYDVTGMQSLEKEYELFPVDKKRLFFLLQSICGLKDQMEDYLLDDGNIIFSSAMVFYDRIRERIRFCYVPGYSRNGEPGMRDFFEEILQNLDHTDSEAVQIGYDVYEQCARVDFVPEDVRRCLHKYREEPPAAEEEKIPADEDCGQPSGEETEWSEPVTYPPKRRKGFFRLRKNGKKRAREDYRGTYDEEQILDYVAEKAGSYSAENQTVYFSREQMKTVWELTYRGSGNESDFRLDKFPYLLGKDAKRVDGVLHADSVSRVHARITEGEEGLYLEDYNSTNGTYLNGSLIPMNTPVLLHRGDQILLSTEEYVLVDRQICT